MRSDRNEIVNIDFSLHFATPTVSGALTKAASVKSAQKWRNFGSEAVCNCPGDSLGEESGGPIPKGHRQVQESEAPPSKSKELDLAWIQKEPSVVAGKVTLPHV